MIRHVVLTKFKKDTDDFEIIKIYIALAALTDTLPGVLDFAGGRSQSPENLERGYMHGFTIDFENWDALQAYSEHPEHQALGAQIVAHAEGGLDGVLVVDFEF